MTPGWFWACWPAPGAETERLAGERVPAEVALAVAETLAAALGVTADSALARWAARLRAKWAD